MSSTLVLALLGALGGVAVAAATRELVAVSPAAARLVAGVLEPARRAGLEGYDPTERERRRLAVAGSVALLAAALWIFGPLPAVIAALAGPAAAGAIVSRRRARYRRAVSERVPEIARATADALAAGRSLRAALGELPASLDGSARIEALRLSAELELGTSMGVTLRHLAARVATREVEALVAVLSSQQIAGGDLVGLLRRHAAAAAARTRAERDARAATAQARFTGLLVAALPLGGAALAELAHPGFTADLVQRPATLVLVVASAALQAIAFAVVRRLGRVT